jgi:alpha-2-macroglobulin
VNTQGSGATTLRQRLQNIGRAAFGNVDIDWQPPPWSRALHARVRAQPVRWIGGTLAAVALLWLVAWLVTRPTPVDPDAIAATLTAPVVTDYTKSPPELSPLKLRFDEPVAPLAAIGKAPAGVQLSPEHPGTWLWSDDRTLVFTPAKDWPIDTTFKIAIDPRRALAPKIRLLEDEYEFATADFEVAIASAEFYQDPEEMALKKAVYALTFSHPVDAASLERSLSFNYRDGAGTTMPAPQKTLTYDERRLKAWVHSAPLDLPENGGKLQLEVAAGVTSTLGGKGSEDEVLSTVELPSLYSVTVDAVEASIAENDRYEPEQVLVLSFNQAMRDADVARALEVRLLPDANPKLPKQAQRSGYSWSSSEVDEAILKQSTLVKLTPAPGEREFIETHGFRYKAPPNRYLHVRVARGIKSFGGFILGAPKTEVLQVPRYPELLRFVGEGALLSLRGERRVSIAARNVPGLRLEVARVLPGALHQLVQNNSGDYANPSLDYISEDSLVEREETRLRFPPGDPAKTRYEGVDLGKFLGEGRRGVFLLSLRDLSDGDADKTPRQTLDEDAGSEHDRRLVVLTDLGVLVKRALDGSRDAFVQSIAGGTPMAGARVRAVARNGETLVEATTDADGRARLPALKPFVREKAAVMLTVEQGSDLSFLPLDADGRTLDYSRFDIGGEANDIEAGALKAALFSDRGLYRPGDTVHLGMIVRAADWSRPLAGLPLELVLTDPRGTTARRERVALGEVGFETFDYTPSEAAPSGTWQAQLYLIGKDDERTEIGSTTVQVREFLPDSMRVEARFSAQVAEGWVKPEGLKALIHAENLFGTPAQERKVEASVVLRPAFPQFARWPGWDFHDPQRAKEGFDDVLPEVKTNAAGDAEIALGLEKYERATYQLSLLARAFEPGSGRNVAASATTLVSDNPYLIGIKRDDNLGYVQRGSKRSAQLIAIGPDAAPIAAKGLRAVLVERRYVSVLTKQDSGLYKYVSQLRLDDRNEKAIDFAGAALAYTLPTDKSGDFRLEIRDAKGVALNRVDYSVAGAANLTRALERNAELTLALSKDSYQPGEEIEVSVRAPYPGAGLITIERDKVYAHAWFKATSNSSVQKIRLPADFEGNGYVNVQFVRDPDSDEVFMSPLSYGVAGFKVDRGARVQPLKIDVPKVSKPGAEIALAISTDGKARVVAFAVDEGILQVARYRVADPLDTFFARKMLQVDTAQILDLILPEFSRLAGASAPGGDAGAELAKHLNPFKRKSERPAVWWSGAVDVDGARTLRFRLPDHFNGRVRVVAVAVTPTRIGIAETTALSRGDFVLTPTLPTHVAPGDEFELPIGVANTVAGGKATLPVTVSLTLPPSLTLVGDASAKLTLAPGREGTARLRLRAGQTLGAVAVGIVARSGKYSAQRRIELSIRPAIAARQDLKVGSTARTLVLKPLREMYVAQSQRRVAASASPLAAIDGLSAYLRDYPHLCTEQIVSAAMPGLVHAAHPEFALLPAGVEKRVNANALDALRTRQNGEGGFGTWLATPEVDPFVSAYAALYLVEARERGVAVPANTMDAANRYLQSLAADRALTTISQLRARSMAVYLLLRQGRSAGNLLSAVREQLERDHPKRWPQDDATALFIASGYRLLQQDKPAKALANAALKRANAEKSDVAAGFVDYYDPGIAQGWSVYLLHKHFPDLAAKLSPVAIERLIAPLRDDRYNTLSSALTLLALEARGAGAAGALPGLQAVDAKGRARAIGEVAGQLRRGTFAPDDRALRVQPASDRTAWYALVQNGYDRSAPPAVQDRGIEIVRDYLDDAGKPVDRVALGAEVTVRLRLRALGERTRGDIAIVDLLPGGFETVMQLPPASGASDADADAQPAAATLALPGTTFAPEHVEPREDRVLLYGNVGPSMQEYRYRIRAGNAGRFASPPVYAESMYERGVYAQGTPGTSIEVGAAKP